MIFVDDLLLGIAGVLFHSLHSLLPTFLHQVNWVENGSLLSSDNACFVFLHLVEDFIICILTFDLLFKFFEFLSHFPVLTHGDLIGHVKVHFGLIIMHESLESAPIIVCTFVGIS